MNTLLVNMHQDLNALNIDHEIFEDQNELSSAQTGAKHHNIELSSAAPTFILKIDTRYVAAILRGDCRIDFNKIKAFTNTKKVALASAEEIKQITNVEIGYVSLINQNLETWIDNLILEKDYVYGGCGVKNATLKINTQDLVRITNAKITDFHKLK